MLHKPVLFGEGSARVRSDGKIKGEQTSPLLRLQLLDSHHDSRTSVYGEF
jgi:hypothetical protein